MSTRYPNLFSPLTIRNVTLKNRICSTGHDTCLAAETIPGEALAEYHRARAEGGAGLIVIEVAGVHESSRYTADMILATHDGCIPGYRAIAQACHASQCVVIGQLFHPGREILAAPGGTAPVAYSSSDTPNERFHVTPRPAPVQVIREIVEGFGQGAARLVAAGLDGVEIVASHGYLPDQFLNPRVNHRSDAYGGDLDGRLRFVRECIAEIRSSIGDRVLGIRISGDALDPDGLVGDEVAEICAALDRDGELDYFSVTVGSSASLGGSVHIAAPMGGYPNAYVGATGKKIRDVVSKPVILTGRITTPQIAEDVLLRGEADICGMTRAMICDPELANKADEDRIEEIRECIGCNQACIGHMHLGYPISCIQCPESGRELRFRNRTPAAKARRIWVIGAGPGGIKAAAVAAERGHEVTLFEKAGRIGGQVLLAQNLPGRGDFGGLVTNLEKEMLRAGVEVRTGCDVTPEWIAQGNPDAIVLATGARPRHVEIDGMDEAHVVGAWDVISETARTGRNVVIADWGCDWIGLGVAEQLARDGCNVRLCVNGTMAGQTIQQYVRDPWLGTLHDLDVQITPLVRLCGVDADTVYFKHTTGGGPLLCEGVDTLVLSLGHESVAELERELLSTELLSTELLSTRDASFRYSGDVHLIGDCLCPRTAEEAVLEGLEIATLL